MKKKIAILSLIAIFAVANTISAQTAEKPAKAKAKTEAKCDKKDDGKKCGKDCQKACCKDKKAEVKKK